MSFLCRVSSGIPPTLPYVTWMVPSFVRADNTCQAAESALRPLELNPYCDLSTHRPSSQPELLMWISGLPMLSVQREEGGFVPECLHLPGKQRCPL